MACATPASIHLLNVGISLRQLNNSNLIECAGLNVPRDNTGAIIGGVLGGVALLILLLLACWSNLTYAFRAKKHLVEDQVYSLVIGARSDDIYDLQLLDSSSEACSAPMTAFMALLQHG